MRFDQRFANRQAQTQATELSSSGLFKCVKNRGQNIAIDPATGVLHHELEPAFKIVVGCDFKHAVVRREFDRVLNQVPKNLLEPGRICPERDLRRVQLRFEGKFFLFNFGLANVQRVPQKNVRVNDFKTQLDFAFTNSGKVQEIVDQPRLQLDIAAYELERFAHRLRKSAFAFKGQDRCQYRGEGSPELVAQHRQEFVFGFAGAFGFSARVFGQGLLANQLLTFFSLSPDLFGLFEKLDEHRDFGAKNIRHDRRENIVHRA